MLMIFASSIIWILVCLYVWFYDFYDFAYYFFSALIFFMPCVDLIFIFEKFLRNGQSRKMWAINGLGLIFGQLMSFGIVLTSNRLYEEGVQSTSVMCVPWLLGFSMGLYFFVNFFLYSRRLLFLNKNWRIKE